MRSPVRVVALVALLSTAPAPFAHAQYRGYYPGGYGRYGYNPYGMDPGAGYMAALGSYARGIGAYEVNVAQAKSINADTMIKWNNALRARQLALRKDKEEQDKKDAVARAKRAVQRGIDDGSDLNRLLMSIYISDPATASASRAKTPIGSAALKEIPFEWDTEAITFCIDQLTAEDALPVALRDPMYAPERAEMHKAVEAAIREDIDGNVTPKSKKRVDEAIAKFHAKFAKNVDPGDLSFPGGEKHFVVVAGLTKLLNDPSMAKVLDVLATEREVPVGELIAFMQSYNLRFAPATTPKQKEIYASLLPLFGKVADEMGVTPSPALDRSGKSFQAAATDAFSGLSWKDIESHSANEVK